MVNPTTTNHTTATLRLSTYTTTYLHNVILFFLSFFFAFSFSILLPSLPSWASTRRKQTEKGEKKYEPFHFMLVSFLRASECGVLLFRGIRTIIDGEGWLYVMI